MPDKHNVYANAWSYLDDRMLAGHMDTVIDDLSSHNVNVAILSPRQIPWPKKNKDGTWEADFSKLDKYIDYIKSSKKLLIFLNFNNVNVREFSGKLNFNNKSWNIVFKRWVRQWDDYLQKHDLQYSDYAFYPVDEPVKSELDVLLYVSKAIKSVDENIEVYTTMTKYPGSHMASMLHKYVDIFQINIKYENSFSADLQQKYNSQYWQYAAIGGGKLADPLQYYRLQAWNAYLNGMNGIGFWAYADIGPAGTAWNDFDGTRPDFSVIYDIVDGSVISSKRWEAWNEGVEDYELLYAVDKFLKGADGHEKVQQIISNVITSDDLYNSINLARSQLFDLF